jgi:transcriptional regulator with XRE-family HTH domain
MKTKNKSARTYSSPLIKKLMSQVNPENLRKTRKRMLIASAITEALKNKGWNKKQFAEEMGKKPPEISKWLSGTHNFNLDTLMAIEHVLDIELIQVEDKASAQPVYQVFLEFPVTAQSQPSYNQPGESYSYGWHVEEKNEVYLKN